MAVFIVIPHDKDPYRETYIAEKITYVLRPDKTISNYWGGYHFLKTTKEDAIGQFYIVRNTYHKSNCILLQHYVISLDPYWEYKITPYQLSCIASLICQEFASCQYQVIYAVHEDKPQLHAHILVNTVNLADGRILTSNQMSLKALLKRVEFILKSYRLWHGERELKLFY